MFTESRVIFSVSGAMFTAVTGDADYPLSLYAFYSDKSTAGIVSDTFACVMHNVVVHGNRASADVTKSFDEKKVLSGVSFRAESGKAFGLLGRNGTVKLPPASIGGGL